MGASVLGVTILYVEFITEVAGIGRDQILSSCQASE